ncbi:MAG: cation-translocating P-type ATPase [Lachnospiraceae bacterium]|nr:cation-translocating P-type ATPase [Lachnospiraceae bacterium]
MYAERNAEEVIRQFESSRERGLSAAVAEERLGGYGPNKLEEQKKKGVFALFMEQLNDPLIYILMAAIAISLFLGEAGDAAIIAAVILLNSIVGVIQEDKARKAIEALQQLSSPKALVLREGRACEIESAKLVPGDIVFLEAGRQVPADLRLIESVNLKIEESALTGESVPVDKTSEKLPPGEKSIGDKVNMAYMSTTVSYGRGVGIVTGTGMATEIGKIAGLIDAGGGEMTPLQRRLADLGKLLSILAIGVCVFLFVVAVLQKRDVGDMLLTAISLAVAAVPEGLAAIVTIVLALSVSRMVKVGTIVRRLPSVETLGAVNTVCSDKTGTLTQNRMTVKECYVDGQLVEEKALDSEKNALFLEACTLCNDAAIDGNRLGDPTELALLDLAREHGFEKKKLEAKLPRIDERAFDSDRKRMTTVHRRAGGADTEKIAYIKGAADEMIAMCTSVSMHGREVAFSAKAKREAREAVEEMANRAYRVLAVAAKHKGDLKDEKNMVFLGLVGMIDPPRKEAKGAVESFQGAHVDTVMITGDHVDTAFAIARDLGIAKSREECMTGAEIEAMDGEAFRKKAEGIRVFARVSPEHKVRIVEALKAGGKIVAMTGDGVNDAPSLKAADVGIAMGKEGTDVARGAADLVLTDDNFATIEKAMKEGRGIYENIRKTILFLLSSNFGEIITMLAAVLVGFPSPLKASHILWINLITDSLPALALGMDKNDGEALMKEKPRKSSDSLFAHGGLSCTVCYGVVIGLISLLAFLTVPYGELLRQHLPVTLQNLEKILRLAPVLNRAQTHAFTVLGMSQLVHAVGMRDTNKSVFGMNHLENRYMIVAWGAGLALQALVTEIPYFIGLFGTSRLSLSEWGVLGALSCVPLVIHELLVLSETLLKKAGAEESEDADKGQGHQDEGRKPGEAAGAL